VSDALGPAGCDWSIVIPSVGRDSLQALLDSVSALPADRPRPAEVIVVDDRRDPRTPLSLSFSDAALRVLRGAGQGPAAARNAGWRAAGTAWIAFLDDDVLLGPDWSSALVADLTAGTATDAASTAHIDVPLAPDRRPTDWERNTAGLSRARWATADMAYRRAALEQVGGFDERFPRAYREDADLAVRVQRAGWGIRAGQRRITHPVRPADGWVSVRVQAGNADDALLRALYGRRWRTLAQTGPGRTGRHLLTVAAAGAALLGAAGRAVGGRTGTGRGGVRAGGPRVVAAVGLLTWAALSSEFALLRILPGPRPGQPGARVELHRMLLTSLAIPPVAVWHRARGAWRWRHGAQPWGPDMQAGVPGMKAGVPGIKVGEPADAATSPTEATPAVRAVLFDRDGTLVQDVPYNGDPKLVQPMPGAAAALARVRAAGLATGVVSNQSGIARGLLSPADVAAVNARVAELLGDFDTWQVCPHGPEQGCGCRKPAPGLVIAAAAELGITPAQCVVVGDIGADVEAATAAGAGSVLVPTPATLPAEVAAAPRVAVDLGEAIDLLLAQTEVDR